MSGGDLAEDQLIISFAGLRISVSRDWGAGSYPSAASSSTGARASTGPLAGPPVAEESVEEPSRDRFRLKTPEEERLLASTGPDEIGSFELGHLAASAAHLASVGPWTPRGRLARAYRAGLFAFEVIEGARVLPEPTPPLELRNKWYICLQSRAKPEGFVTSSYRTFIRLCPHEKDGRLEEGSVSHGFASRAEVVAYLAGARAQWPPEL